MWGNPKPQLRISRLGIKPSYLLVCYILVDTQLLQPIFITMALHALPKRAPRALRAPLTRRFATSPRTASYADTLPNLKIGAHTKVLFQGFTGEHTFVLSVMVGI